MRVKYENGEIDDRAIHLPSSNRAEFWPEPTPRIDLVSVDYSRAFDSISHVVLLEKLHRTYGFRGPVCRLSFQTRSGIILLYIACRLLKRISKVNLLKLAMLSGSWTLILPVNCKSSANVYP